MIRSLLLKLSLLVIALGVSFWMLGTNHPQGQQAFATDQRATKVVSTPSFPPEPMSKIEAATRPMSATETSLRLLDLNRASAGDLVSLPGIGPVLAQRVLAFRDSAGGFRTIEDLRAVKGIGSKKYDRLKSLVTVPPLKSYGAKQHEL
jgi:competence protein ComEA